MKAALLALRDADPAAGVDVAAIAPDWATVSAAMVDAGAGPEVERSRPSGRFGAPSGSRKLRVAVVGPRSSPRRSSPAWSPGPDRASRNRWLTASRSATASCWSDCRPAIRCRPCNCRRGYSEWACPQSCSRSYCPANAPRRRRSECRLKHPVVSFPSSIGRGEGFAINPAAIPSGDVLLVELPPADGPQFDGGSFYAGLVVTADPPACVSGGPIERSS